MLLDEYDNSRIREAMLSNSIRVVEQGALPTSPSRPRMELNIALALFVGIVGGTGLAFLIENLDPRIHSVERLEAAGTVAVLGAVPGYRVPRKLRGEPVLLDSQEPSSAGEAFRMVRSTILSEALSGNSPKTLLVVSAEPGAGKTTVVANLAAVMAQTGREVIVVDSDLRQPRLHRVFGLDNGFGLTDAILQPDLAKTRLQRTRISRLRVLTSGPLSRNSADLLSSAGMRVVIQQLAEVADVVLFDSAPMSVVVDGIALAAMVDGVLFVVSRGETPGDTLQKTLRQLDKVGARVLGMIFNKARPDGPDGYYSRYGRAPA